MKQHTHFGFVHERDGLRELVKYPVVINTYIQRMLKDHVIITTCQLTKTELQECTAEQYEMYYWLAVAINNVTAEKHKEEVDKAKRSAKMARQRRR